MSKDKSLAAKILAAITKKNKAKAKQAKASKARTRRLDNPDRF